MENKDVINEHINQKIIMTSIIAFVIGFVYWNLSSSPDKKMSRGVASTEEAQTKNSADGE